jgi:hypothetical protein
MLPYSAQDVLRVMRHELAAEVERGYGARIARDVDRKDDHSDDANRKNDRGGRTSPLTVLRAFVLPRGA